MKAAEVYALLRHNVSELVKNEASLGRSRMRAYNEIGERIGASGHWVRKFLGQHGSVPNLIVGLSIVEEYSRLCERIEQAAQNERKIVVKREANEIDQGHRTMGVLASSTFHLVRVSAP